MLCYVPASQRSSTRQQSNFYKEKTLSCLTTICDNGLQNDCAGLFDLGGLDLGLLSRILESLIKVGYPSRFKSFLSDF